MKGSPVKKCTKGGSSADLDGDQGAGEILGVERDMFPGGEDTRGGVAHGLFQEGFGVFFIPRNLIDRGLVEECPHRTAIAGGVEDGRRLGA
jgi:hypothetical protein